MRLRVRLGAVLAPLLAAGCQASLDIEPRHFSECAGATIAVDVRWDARAIGTPPYHIHVHRPGRPETLWATVPARGVATTGEWMSDGSTLTLRDDHGRYLARRTLTSSDC